MGSDVLKVRMAAFSVALAAKDGRLDPSAVDALWYLAENFLPEDDPLLGDIQKFRSAYEVSIRRPERVALLGCDLLRAVEIAARPDAPDAGRADLHG